MTARSSLVLAFLACACASGRDRSLVPELVREGRYSEAVTTAAELHAEDPSAETEAAYERATIAAHLERARIATLDDRDEEALAHVREAERLAPENPVVVDWSLKVRRKLSHRWLTTAHEFESRSELAAAHDAFERVLEYEPDQPVANAGRQRMLLLMNYRQGLGETYYREGVRSLRNFWLHQANAQFDYVGRKYIPGDESALKRGEAVDHLLAAERVEHAQEFEAVGNYFAAGSEYRLALLLEPDNADAQAGRARMEREMEAKALLDRADWLRLRGRYDEAREALSEGSTQTESQSDQFASAAIDIDQAEYHLLYEEALRLEHDFRYEEAVVAYAKLLEVAQYYLDAITRKETLEDFIARAEDLYARAMEAPDARERLALFEELHLFWPEYRDVEERMAALQAELAPAN